MGNNEGRPAVHEPIHTLLDNLLRSGINRAGCFIQDQHRRIGNRCPGDGKKLPLPLA